MADAVQTTVSARPVVGLPGMLADANVQDVKIDSLIADEDLAFGIYVETTETNCSKPEAAGDITGGRGGIVLRDPTKATTTGYKTGDVVPVLRKGRVFVLAEEAVTYDDPVYVRHTTPGSLGLGVFRDDADTATASILPNAAYRYGGDSTNPPVLDLDLLG